jgi:hypothetical protein
VEEGSEATLPKVVFPMRYLRSAAPLEDVD